MIDPRPWRAYASARRPPWAAGIDVLETERSGAHTKRFFCACRSMVGVMGALRSAVPRYRNVNLVAPATLSIDVVGGGSQPTGSLL